jgi:hypothetical protein
VKNITRKISMKVFTAKAVKYVDGEMVEKDLEPFKTGKRITKTGVIKHFEKELSDDSYSIVLTGEGVEEKTYSMPVEAFMDLAIETEDSEEESEEN